MRIPKKDLAIAAYWVSVVVLLAAGAWYILNRQFDLVIQVALILAGVAVIVGILADPNRVRNALASRQTRYGSNAILFSLAFFGILSVINFLIYSNPIKADLTEDRLYSLSPETLRVLEALPGEVKIRGFYTVGMADSRENVRPLLDQYRLKSDDKLEYEFIDPEENPFVAQQFNIIRDGSLAITMGETSEVVEFVSEEKITEALVRVLNPQEHKIYFLVGHGERDIDGTDEFGYGQANRSLVSKNYEVENLNLLSEGSIPEDTSALIIAAPLAQLLENEIELIAEYMQDGGSLIVLIEPMGASAEEVEADLLIDYLNSQWGIEPVNNLVVDTSSNLPFYGISFQYSQHPITEKLGNLATYFPTARSLKVIDLQEASIARNELVLTGDNSWGETDFNAVENQEMVEFNEGLEEGGPLPIVISAEDSMQASRIVVFGDADFASNTFFFELGNGDLLLNSIDWVVGEEQLISLTPKQTTTRYVLPPTNQVVGVVFLITIILIPGIVIVVGVLTWWQRRKRE